MILECRSEAIWSRSILSNFRLQSQPRKMLPFMIPEKGPPADSLGGGLGGQSLLALQTL